MASLSLPRSKMRRVSRRVRRADLALGLGAKPVPELVALAHEHVSAERLLSRP
jgi:hypothetical protein